MRTALLAATLASLALSAAPALAQHDNGRHEQSAGDRHDNGRRPQAAPPRMAVRDKAHNFTRYDYNRPDPRYGNYRAERYYVTGNQYKSRRLGANERIYRGSDNRYYCRRSDGTTGLIIGGLTGGALGSAIAPGGSKTLATLVGGGLGALLGQSIDRGSVTCR